MLYNPGFDVTSCAFDQISGLHRLYDDNSGCLTAAPSRILRPWRSSRTASPRLVSMNEMESKSNLSLSMLTRFDV